VCSVGVVLVFLGCEFVGVHDVSFLCSFVLLVYHMCTWCCQLVGGCVVSHYILFTVASAVFFIVYGPCVGCGVCWCVFLVFVLFSWCVMCVTVFCFVFAGFVFLDSTNSFFVAYVTIFCVR